MTVETLIQSCTKLLPYHETRLPDKRLQRYLIDAGATDRARMHDLHTQD